MTYLSNFVDNMSGDESTNLVACWHGGCQYPFEVAENNFSNDPINSLDSGYFGKGFYFTHLMSYGAKYTKYREKFKKMAPGTPLILSWVIMGNPYPVVEHPFKSNSLKGKDCKSKYDSHYVLLKHEGGMHYVPCNPLEEHPVCDEIVVFNPDQILPRCLVYIDQVSDFENQQFVFRTILWVDSNFQNNLLLIEKLKNAHIQVIQFQSSNDVLGWLATLYANYTKCNHDVVIISNGFRDIDGGENAGKHLCNYLKQSEWKDIPFLLYCTNKELIEKPIEFADVVVSDKYSEVFEWATAKKFIPPKNILNTPKVQEPSIWMNPNYLRFEKHRRREYNPNITKSYKGSSWQIAEYKDKFGKIWVGKIPGLPLADLLKEVVGAIVYSKCKIPVASVKISSLPIFNNTIINLVPKEDQFAIISEKIENLILLGPSFVKQLTTSTKSNKLNYSNLWELIAVAHWIGDSDCIGACGNNAGFILSQKLYPITNAIIVKIDTGYFLASEKYTLSKDILICPDKIINFDKLANVEKILFIKKISEIIHFTDKQIYDMVKICIDTNAIANPDSESFISLDPKSIVSLRQFNIDEFCNSIAKTLISRRDSLQKLYVVELQSYSASSIVIASKPGSIWMNPNLLEFKKHRIREYNPDISQSFKGSSWQVADYSDRNGNTWVGKIPGQPLAELLKDVIGANIYSKCGVFGVSVKITSLPIFNKNIETTLPKEYQLATISEKLENLVSLGSPFVEQLTTATRDTPISFNELLKKAGYDVIVTNYSNLWELIAVGHWIGDSDCVGTNTKLILKHDERLTPFTINVINTFAIVVKMDTGFFLDAHDKNYLLSKNVVVCTNKIINFDTLKAIEKKKFIKKINEIVRFSDQQIYEMVQINVEFESESIDTRDANYYFLDKLKKFPIIEYCGKIAGILISRRDSLKEIYATELQSYFSLVPAPAVTNITVKNFLLLVELNGKNVKLNIAANTFPVFKQQISKHLNIPENNEIEILLITTDLDEVVATTLEEIPSKGRISVRYCTT